MPNMYAKINQATVNLKDRDYFQQNYQIGIWPKFTKIDLFIKDGDRSAILKMSKEECEELILRLQYALLQAEAARGELDDD